MLCQDRNQERTEGRSLLRSKLPAYLLLGGLLFIWTLPPSAQASNYQYDPDLAAQLLSEAGVSSTTSDEVLGYLDARDQAYQNLQSLFAASAPFAYLVELEKRERTYQKLLQAAALNSLNTKVENRPSVRPLPTPSLIDRLDALSAERHSAYESIHDQTGDPTTLDQMAIFDSGISGLVSLATVTGQPALIQDYLNGTISGSTFVANLDAGAIPGLLEHSIEDRIVIEQTFLDEYETFASALTAALGAGAEAYFDYLDTMAETLIDAAQSASVHHLPDIHGGTDFERDLIAALLTSASAETFSSLFAYLGERRTAYGAVLGELGDATVTDDLFESIEYQLEAWEVQAKADEAAIRDDPHLKSMDTTDHAIGAVLVAVVDLGYSQFNPYAGMTVDDAFATFNNDVAEASSMVADADSSTPAGTMEDLKKRLREIKEIKEILKGLKILMKDEMEEEDYKKLCKYIRIGCVLLRAACDILDILCEDDAEDEKLPKEISSSLPLNARGWPSTLEFDP